MTVAALTPYYQALYRQTLMKLKGNYYLNSIFVKLQDLIENELRGQGDLVEGSLRQYLRAKSLNTGHYEPILHGSNIIPIQVLIEARKANKRLESDDEVGAFLRRHGIDYPAKTTHHDAKHTVAIAVEKAPAVAAVKAIAKKEEGSADNDKAPKNQPTPLEKLIIYRLLGLAPESDEVDDFLRRHGLLDSTPTPTPPRPRI